MRNLALVLAASLMTVLAAGCAQEPAPEPDAVVLPLAEPLGPLPSMTKSTASSSVAPMVAVLDDGEPEASFSVGATGSRMQLALDLAQQAAGELTVRVVAPDGSDLASRRTSSPGKLVLELPYVAKGTHDVHLESAGQWTVGMVITEFPPGSMIGARIQVSYPEQTAIDHSFVPDVLEANAGEPLRITLFDFDPHAGIDNLQHDLHFPALGLGTQGQTTWGEARVLDLPGLPAGEYAFECQYHGFAGKLVVA